jgi:phage terminase small subunit
LVERLISMKKGTFNRKQLKFLEEYITTGNPAKAYLAAGYKSKTMETARTSGYRLLRKLDETMDYRGILETVGLTDRRVAEVMKGLVDHPDPRVRVQALNIATKCLGWYEETQNVNLGFQVIIGGREPAQVQGSQEPIKIALKKPIA